MPRRLSKFCRHVLGFVLFALKQILRQIFVFAFGSSARSCPLDGSGVGNSGCWVKLQKPLRRTAENENAAQVQKGSERSRVNLTEP